MTAPSIRALLVEDNPADAQLLRELLEEAVAASVALVQASRLSEALEVLAGGGVDVVLLDLSLPDALGMGTVERMHAAAPGVPIVVLTGLDDDVTALRALQVGAEDYLVKGQVDAPQLSRAIRYAIGRKQAEEAALRLAREQTARAEAEAAAARFQLVAEASRELAASLDYRTTLPTVAHLVVPLLGDACAIDVLEDGRLRRLGSAQVEGEAIPEAAEGDGAGCPIREALRTGGPVVRVREEGALLATPLLARGQLLGALCLRRLAPHTRYGPEDLALAHELAGQLALAVDNARLYRAREEVLGIVSHDLRNPLAVIGLAVANLRRPELSPVALARQVDKLDRAAEQMRRLITDLLDLTRVEAGTLTVQPERLEPAALMREAHEMLRPLAEARGLQLELQVASDLPEAVADRDRALQVLSNLVGNALKFTPPGGRVLLGAEHAGAELCFSVADTGPGIPREDLDRIFDRYWQGGRANRHGAGLGLAISRGLVQAQGGRIWVKSEVGLGTTFFFTLPAVAPEAAPWGRTTGSGAEAPPTSGGLRD